MLMDKWIAIVVLLQGILIIFITPGLYKLSKPMFTFGITTGIIWIVIGLIFILDLIRLEG
jgi:hypothetical protein